MSARKPASFSRRQFVRLAAAAGLGTALAACGGQPTVPTEPQPQALSTPTGQPATPTEPQPSPSATPAGKSVAPTEPQPQASPTSASRAVPSVEPTPTAGPQTYLAVARGEDPRAITRAALAAIGGMERFLRAGDQVVIKPNICVDYRSYEFGATTNPDVLAALVEMCLAAGAARVRVMDTPFSGAAERAYARSGIGAAVKAAGGEMVVMNPAKFRETEIPEGRDIRRWALYQDVLDADLLIDVPVAKHHSLARLTLAGKNLMGIAQNPNMIHANLGQRVADLVSRVRPALTVVDAVRIMVRHGPTGGSLDDVRLTNTVIASHDIVAADAYAATLFGLTGADIAYVRAEAEMGLGTIDLSAVKIAEIPA